MVPPLLATYFIAYEEFNWNQIGSHSCFDHVSDTGRQVIKKRVFLFLW